MCHFLKLVSLQFLPTRNVSHSFYNKNYSDPKPEESGPFCVTARRPDGQIKFFRTRSSQPEEHFHLPVQMAKNSGFGRTKSILLAKGAIKAYKAEERSASHCKLQLLTLSV